MTVDEFKLSCRSAAAVAVRTRICCRAQSVCFDHRSLAVDKLPVGHDLWKVAKDRILRRESSRMELLQRQTSNSELLHSSFVC